MKLSSAQQRVMDKAMDEIKEARNCNTFEEYYNVCLSKCFRYTTSEEYAEKDPRGFQASMMWWNLNRDGVVFIQADGRTIRKLESLGYIKIIHDSTGTGSHRCDTIQILNF